MDGILIIDKPAGFTSHDVVARVRRILRERRVGHTGTLDPFATGVLVILVGRATRLAQFLAGEEKEYEALIRFGYATTTGDATGEPRAGVETSIADRMMSWNDALIEAALHGLRGEIEQRPPMYSAKKVKGRKLYELAREGVEVERASVRVRVHEFEIVRRASGAALLTPNADGSCDLPVRVVCSAGTYVRTLAESLGEQLEVGAHLVALRRTRAGSFKIEEALSLTLLEEMSEAGRVGDALLPADAALSRLPFVHLTAEDARRARSGARLRVDEASSALYEDGQWVGMRDEQGDLIGVALYDHEAALLRPRVVIATEK